MTKILSLCLTTQLMSDNYEGNNHKTVLFRLKDVEGDVLVDYQRTNDFDEGYQEDTSSKYPHTDHQNHIINELKIWEWDPFEKNWAIRTNRVFYELIRDYSMDHLSINEKINTLKNGVCIEKYEGQPCLLVFEETEKDYFVIYVDSSILKKQGATYRLDNSVTNLSGYYLLKDDFFTTEHVKVLDENGDRYLGRTVYKYLKLNEPDDHMDVLLFEEKLNLFVQTQVKAFNISKSERKNIKSFLDVMLKEPFDIKKFFEENEWSTENIEASIALVKNQIDEVFIDENLRMSICQGLIKNSNSIAIDLKKKIEDEYLVSHKKELSIRNKELSAIDYEIKQMTNKKNSINAQLIERQIKIEELEEKIDLLKGIDAKFSDKIKEQFNKANSDIVEFLAKFAMFNSNPKELSIIKESKAISKCVCKSHTEEPYLIDSTNEMIDTLKNNLDAIGIDKELSYSLSNYILCSIKQGINLSFVGKYGKLLFDCVSKSLSGDFGELLYINSASILKEELLESINKTEKPFIGTIY